MIVADRLVSYHFHNLNANVKREHTGGLLVHFVAVPLIEEKLSKLARKIRLALNVYSIWPNVQRGILSLVIHERLLGTTIYLDRGLE